MKTMKMDMRMPGLVVKLTLAAGVLFLGGCAYHDTMNQRNSENQYLRQQLEAEQERSRRLSE